MLFRQKLLENGLTLDRVKKLKHDVPTRLHLRFSSILSYIKN